MGFCNRQMSANGEIRVKRCASDEIAEVLRGELSAGRYRVGETLPSVDVLRSRFAVGEYAVRSAIRKLQEEGLVSVTKHVGAVVTAKSAFAWKGHIAFVHTSMCCSYFVQRFALQLSRRFEAAGWTAHLVFLEPNVDGKIDVEPLMRHVSAGIDFAVVYSEFRQIAQLLDRAAVPYVVLDGFTRDFPNAHAVIKMEAPESFAAMIQTMKERGVKTLLEIDYDRRMDRSFKLLLADAGMTVRRELCKWNNETTASLSDVKLLGYRAVARYLSGCSDRASLPDAILFDDDYLADGGIVAILEAGLRIPDDIGVAMFSNRGNELVAGRSFARIENDPVPYGDAVARYVLALLAGRRVAPPRVKMRFIPGKSL